MDPFASDPCAAGPLPPTPRDIAAHLPAPAGPVGALTELFVAARYGPDEPSEEQAVAAERAGQAVAAGLGRHKRI